ncbi:MAG: hypothetical protein Q4E62_01400 [Sutterellaceae bacterium]|nr:hypothetical protein [Sutterellaceae bacterium]
MAQSVTSNLVPWWHEAKAHLAKHPILGSVVAQFPDMGLEVCEDYVRALVRTVCGQQVSNAAAAKLAANVLTAADNAGELTLAQKLCDLGSDGLRACGLSQGKAGALYALMAGVVDGRFAKERLSSMNNADIGKELCEIKGIGPWSVTMILIFALGRPDVWAGRDYGVRKAIEKLGAREENFEDCAPFQTAATWYLWRTLTATPVKY